MTEIITDFGIADLIILELELILLEPVQKISECQYLYDSILSQNRIL